MGHLIFQFIPVEGDHLIEVDLLAARQDADLAAIFGILGAGQNGSAQLCVLCKVLLIVHGMAEAQPGIAGNGQAGQGFQQADGPVPPLILQILMLQLPVPSAARWPAPPAPACIRPVPPVHSSGGHPCPW